MTEPDGYKYQYKIILPPNDRAVSNYNLMEQHIARGDTKIAEKYYDRMCDIISGLTGFHKPMVVTELVANELLTVYQIDDQYASEDDKLTFNWDDQDGQYIQAAPIDEWIQDNQELENIDDFLA